MKNKKNWDWLIYKSKQRVDFYLPSYNIVIECQGIQHFESLEFFGGEEEFKSTIEKDKNKFNLCEQHGIKILYFSNLGEDYNYPYKVYTDIKTLIDEVIGLSD